MFRAQIREEIRKIIGDDAMYSVERSENPEHGDYSSNVALVLAKKGKKNSREVAEGLKAQIVRSPALPAGRSVSNILEKVEIAGPGFLNFWIKKEALTAALLSSTSDVKSPKHRMFSRAAHGKKINIEFVSANPTGPLTMANGRGGFYGDALVNILEAVGHKVTREYYINDAGNQIRIFKESLLAELGFTEKKDEHYKGEYIKNYADSIRRKLKEAKARGFVGAVIGGIDFDLAGAKPKIIETRSPEDFAAIAKRNKFDPIEKYLKDIKSSTKKAGIEFDVWFSEDKDIHKSGALKKILEFLVKNKLVKEKEGALWLDDAVIIKSNKEPTYFLADLAYHYDKFIKRKFDVCINVWGADHHGYVERMKNGVGTLGIDSKRLQIIVMQMVRLVSKGKEVKMSKRAGEFVTLDELIKMVGLDAARWFFLERSPDTHMDFDLDLAKERSKKNPVYYVQYAYARCRSILRKSQISKSKFQTNSKSQILNLLNKLEELALIKKILQLPELIEDISNDYQVHRLPRYAYELAQVFTNFYEKHHVVDEKNLELTEARLFLVRCTLNAIRYTLNLMGIASPEKM